jgi:AAA15 family ATPase/GTPase
MIIRFVAKNIYSFKEETEFNLLPNKTQRHPHHKVDAGEFSFLRFSAIYGANGAGKSNLIKAIDLLKSIIIEGRIVKDINKLKFKLDEECKKNPVSLAIEFYHGSRVFYYTITFDENVILHEYLAESKKDKDILIFGRLIEDGKQTITFSDDYYKNETHKQFVEVAEKFVARYELLLTFLSERAPEDFEDIKNVFGWFESRLVIIMPDSKPTGGIATLLEDVRIKKFANELISSLNTGIVKLEVEKKEIEEIENDAIEKIKNHLKNNPGAIYVARNRGTGKELSYSLEDGELIEKRLVTTHTNNLTTETAFELYQESDGTKRLIDYIPVLDGIINADKVYLIDEIEWSIHPILIKEIIKKLSLDENMKGQLIFTTHESNLLDQGILRPDEIWFAQKDRDGASKLYSLSDFKIHHTVDIENGYLNGRYGGIPFLSNLKDLNWT